MKPNKFKLNFITLSSLVFQFVAEAAIFIKFSPDSDQKISDSVKNEIHKSVKKFQIPPLRIQ
ncbi:hypothetical protein CH378_18045 [Leptospira kmetyi]|uniref:Uncharacterized protein n=1 Tax=Leptospira kmetyi TaxID=408139 RepID=A0ABX4N4Z1_9LEPT|nr:hypothetical protein CH378_18045 [Leptospira kmetyi]